MSEHLTPTPDAAPPTSAPLPRRAAQCRWPAVLAALILLISGGVIGGVMGSLKVRSDVVHAMHNPDEMIGRFNQHMSVELGLSDDQSARIKEILEQRHAAIDEHRQQIVENMQMLQQEVAEVLTAKQAEQWKLRVRGFERRGFGFREHGRHGRRRGPRRHHRPPPNGFRAELGALFETSDQDGDGKLTLEEFAGDGPEPQRAKKEQFFERLDADADGLVTPPEVEAFSQRRQHRRPGAPPDAEGAPPMRMPQW